MENSNSNNQESGGHGRYGPESGNRRQQSHDSGIEQPWEHQGKGNLNLDSRDQSGRAGDELSSFEDYYLSPLRSSDDAEGYRRSF